MRITFDPALLAIVARVLNKDCVEAGWYDPAACIPLLRPSINRIYYRFFGISSLSEFDNVKYRNTTERD
jgi:hypothetical protein